VISEAESHLGKYRYSQGPARYTPWSSGYTDCSAFIRVVYLRSVGIDVGMNTVLQWQGSRTREIQRGNFKNGQWPNPALIQPGDLIYYYNGWSGRGANSVDHVIMAVNGTDSIDMSVNNGIPGPARNKINTKISWSKGPWYLMRVL
jgi:cell wall-associated NlpC family hydrolase